MLLFAAFAALPAQTQTYTVLHRFTGPDGFLPEAGLIADPAGNLFGTTLKGGTSDCGTVFKLDKTGIMVVHNFTCEADGGYPYAGLIRDSAGNLYGLESGGRRRGADLDSG
jgi:uncharacterized repeat protein (TIGR03803 family)